MTVRVALVIVWIVALISLSEISIAQATQEGNSIKVSFTNVAGDQPLQLNDGVYANALGDSFSVTMYKYYISNVKLITAAGDAYAEPESYHLINEAKPDSKVFTMTGVPTGRYIKLRFTIGVDSLHNVSGAQAGALDPINAMFWDWNTGYIMAKMEGNTRKKKDNEISYHLGGFAGPNSVLRTVTIVFSKALDVEDNDTRTIGLKSDVLEWFKTPNEVDFSKMPVVTTEGKEATSIADNYADMFTLDYVE